MNRMSVRWMIFIIGILFVGKVTAQVYPITDRSFAYATAYTIPKGHAQLELGYFDVWDLNKEEFPDLTGFSGLFRCGIAETAEIRARIGRLNFDLGDENFAGWDGLELSTKLAVIPEGAKLPSVGLLMELDIPWAGKEEIRESSLSPSMKFIFEKYLNPTFIIGCNFGWQWLSGDSALANYSISLRTALSDVVAIYSEFYGFNNGDIGARDFVDVAVELWMWDGVAIDFVLGFGITENADRGFWSGGVSYYF